MLPAPSLVSPEQKHISRRPSPPRREFPRARAPRYRHTRARATDARPKNRQHPPVSSSRTPPAPIGAFGHQERVGREVAQTAISSCEVVASADRSCPTRFGSRAAAPPSNPPPAEPQSVRRGTPGWLGQAFPRAARVRRPFAAGIWPARATRGGTTGQGRRRADHPDAAEERRGRATAGIGSLRLS